MTVPAQVRATVGGEVDRSLRCSGIHRARCVASTAHFTVPGLVGSAERGSIMCCSSTRGSPRRAAARASTAPWCARCAHGSPRIPVGVFGGSGSCPSWQDTQRLPGLCCCGSTCGKPLGRDVSKLWQPRQSSRSRGLRGNSAFSSDACAADGPWQLSQPIRRCLPAYLAWNSSSWHSRQAATPAWCSGLAISRSTVACLVRPGGEQRRGQDHEAEQQHQSDDDRDDDAEPRHLLGEFHGSTLVQYPLIFMRRPYGFVRIWASSR